MRCEKDLAKLQDDLEKEWKLYLKDKGVKFPSGKRLSGLLCLYENIENAVSQDDIHKWFTKRKLGTYDRQIRHIADDGWYIVGGNTRATRYEIDDSLSSEEVKLKSVSETNPIWSEGNQKRLNYLNAEDWQQILDLFSSRGCAVCGLKFNNYDKGHLLFSKGYEVENIVPMCSSCNNWGQMYNLEFELDNQLRARPILKKK